MRTQTIVIFVLLATSLGLYSQEGTRAVIQGKSGDNWVLDKGAADGVAAGLKGYFWTSKKSGDKWYSLKIARFQVVKIEDKKCQVKLEDASEGFSEMEYQWATFMEILKAPTPRPQTLDAKLKVEKPVDNQPNLELAFWEAIKDSKNVDDFKEYLVKYPNGTFSGLVKNRIKILETSSKQDAELAAARVIEEHQQRQAEEVLAAERARYEIEMVSIPGKNYSIGKYEVTQSQWQAVMDNNPSYFKKGGSYPVEFVSWNLVQEFVRKLNTKTGNKYRLPTYDEWVFAAQAGTSGVRYGEVDDIAWYHGNSGGTTQPVGQKQPNAFGLYDMLGNVWEWHQDYYDWDGPARAFCGGGWNERKIDIRSKGSLKRSPDDFSGSVGFRLASD